MKSVRRDKGVTVLERPYTEEHLEALKLGLFMNDQPVALTGNAALCFVYRNPPDVVVPEVL